MGGSRDVVEPAVFPAERGGTGERLKLKNCLNPFLLLVRPYRVLVRTEPCATVLVLDLVPETGI